MKRRWKRRRLNHTRPQISADSAIRPITSTNVARARIYAYRHRAHRVHRQNEQDGGNQRAADGFNDVQRAGVPPVAAQVSRNSDTAEMRCVARTERLADRARDAVDQGWSPLPSPQRGAEIGFGHCQHRHTGPR